MEFETAKVLLGVGLILILLGLFPVGIILALIGLYSLSKHYGKEDIFTNALYAAVFSIAGAVAAVAAFFASAATLRHLFFSLPIDFEEFSHLFLAWGIFSAFQAASSYFMKRSFEALGAASGVEIFKTAATLTLIGGLTVVVLVGLVVLFVAFLLATVGAFALRPPRQLVVQA